MNQIKRNILLPLLCLLIAPAFSGCDSKDDVAEIFTGKAWKLTRLTNKGSNQRFYEGIWRNEESYKQSMERLNQQPAAYSIAFEGSEINGELVGSNLKGNGATSSFSGTWMADADTKAMNIGLKVVGTESDPLGKAFLIALQKVYKYEGDVSSLTLYYKEDNGTTRIIGLTRQR